MEIGLFTTNYVLMHDTVTTFLYFTLTGLYLHGISRLLANVTTVMFVTVSFQFPDT